MPTSSLSWKALYTQQDVFITDVTSVLPHTHYKRDGLYYDLNQASKQKFAKYYKYNIPRDRFHPLSVGRMNVLSDHTLRFCEIMASYFAKPLNVYDKLRATFSRAITVGTAFTLSEAVRRLQLAAANAVALSMVPAIASPAASRVRSRKLGTLQKVYSVTLKSTSHSLRLDSAAHVADVSCAPTEAPLSPTRRGCPLRNDVAGV